MDESFWNKKKICITGGAGFLGQSLVENIKRRGATDIFIPTIEKYDLVQQKDILRMLDDSRPDVIIHLAAHVGGIGANREHPAEFFYDNLMMGVQLMHEAWKKGVEKFVAVGTSAPTPSSRPYLSVKTISGMVTRKRPMRLMAWRRKCCWCRPNPTASSMAITRSS